MRITNPRSVRAAVLLAVLPFLASVSRAEELASRIEPELGYNRLPSRPALRSVVVESAVRGELATPLTTPDDPAPLAQRLDRSHRFDAPNPLLQRISANLGGVSHYWSADRDMAPPVFNQTLRRGVVRATRKAVKRVVLEALDVDRIGDRVFPSLGGPARADGVRFRLGVSHLAPRLDVRCPLREGDMNLSLGARGQVGVDFNTGGVAQAQMHVGYDRSSRTYAFSFRMGF